MQIHKSLALTTASMAALGLFVTIGPIAAIGVAVFILLFILAMEQPKMTFYAAIAIILAVPIYIVIPPVGFLPNLPVSLLPLAGILTICLLEVMLKPKQPVAGIYGQILVATLYLFAIISLASATDEKSTRETLLFWIRAVAIPLSTTWLSIRMLQTLDDVKKLFYVLMFAGVCVSGFAVQEFISGHNVLIEKLIMSSDSELRDSMAFNYLPVEDLSKFGSLIYRCASVFLNAIEFGAFMSMIFPFPLVAAVFATGRLRWFYSLIALFCLLGVLLSFSRGPILTSSLEIFGLALLLRPLRRVVFGSVLAIALTIVLAWPLIGDSITSRVNDVDNVTGRFRLWEIGLHLFADHPVLGIGLGNYPRYKYEAEHDYKIPIVEWGGHIDHLGTIDNSYIQLAAETGLIGFGAYMSTLLVFSALIIKLYRRSQQNSDNQLKTVALGIGFGGFGYYLNAITYTEYNYFVVTEALYIFLSAAIVLERYSDANVFTPRSHSCA